jgi:hypothetical protein
VTGCRCCPRLSSDHDWKSRIFSLFDEVRAALKAEFGYELMITYGTLLGCVREGGFIKQAKAFAAAHIRRSTGPEVLRRKLTDRYGMRILHHEEAHGLSACKKEDPHLCRLIAARG